MSIFSLAPGSKQLITVRVLFFLSYAGFASYITFFFLYLEQGNGFSGMQIGIIAALQQINTIFAPPFWGMLADRYNRKTIYLIVLFGIIVLFYGFYLSHSFIFYVGFIFLFTFFYNPINALLDNLAIDTLATYPHTTFGELRLWGSIGWAASTIITGQFITNENLGYIFTIASTLLATTWLISVCCYREEKSTRKTVTLSRLTLVTLFKLDKRLNAALLILLAYGIFSAPIHMFMNVYYASIGATYKQVGYAYAVQALFELPFFFYGKQIIRRLGIENSLLLTMLITALRMLCYGLVPNPWVSIAVGAAHGVGYALFFLAIVDYLHGFVPKNLQATGHSLIYASYFGAGVGLGNLFTGQLKDWVGMQSAMLIQASLILLLLTIVLALRYKYVTPKE